MRMNDDDKELIDRMIMEAKQVFYDLMHKRVKEDRMEELLPLFKALSVYCNSTIENLTKALEMEENAKEHLDFQDEYFEYIEEKVDKEISVASAKGIIDYETKGKELK